MVKTVYFLKNFELQFITLMDQPKILVAIRKRPLSTKEQAKGQKDIISVRNQETVLVSEYKQKVDLTRYIQQTPFNFDFAYDENTTNQQVQYLGMKIYDSAVRPLVNSAFQGARVTCFAYGQTGSGKTYTMNGNIKMNVIGLYGLGASDIFYYLEEPKFQHLQARVSYFEIYCGKLFDLLNKRKELKILQDKKSNINIIGVEQTHVTSWEQFLELVNAGSAQRVTSQNSANSESSRSHAILQISLKDGKKTFGKISFIDLAGNERGADHTDMKKQTKIDGAEINKSLLALKECIRALDQGKNHTPFRGSKLTMVLKDSFIGFCRTVMIGNVSPSSQSSQNTLNTLRYADRVKQLRKPIETVSKEQLKAREMLLPRHNKNAIKINIENDDDAEDIGIKRQEAQQAFGTKDQHIKLNNYGLLSNKKEEKIEKEKITKGLIKSKKLIHCSPSPVSKKEAKLILPSSVSPPGLTRKSSKNMQKQTETRGNFQNTPIEGKLKFEFRSNSINIVKANPNNIHIHKQANNEENSLEKIKQINNYFSDQSSTQQKSQFENYYINRASTNQSSQFISFGADKGKKSIQKKSCETHRKQNISIPNSWEGMIELQEQLEEGQNKRIIRDKIQENFLLSQNQLMSNHSDCLRNCLEIIRSQMSTLRTLQHEQNYLTTREYLSFMQKSIDHKMNELENLREQMVQLSYRLDTVQKLDSQIHDDEQLLNDLH